jgi:outer membrane protein assembly factor BamB
MTVARLSLLLAALLAGCSIFGKSNPEAVPAQLGEFKPAAQFSVRWHASVGEAGNSVLTPAITQDAVYAANAKGELFRLERTSGKQVWRVDSGFTVTGGVGAGDELVLVGGEKGDLAAFGEDGKLRWKVKVSSEVLSAPQVANGIVVVRTGDGRIAGLSAIDGRQQWLYEHSTPALIVRSHASVLINSGAVFAGFAGGRLVAIDLRKGTVLWETMVSQPRGNTELERISDITSLPVMDDEQICAVAFQGQVACFDLKQGNLLWNRELSSDKGLALQNKNLYLTDADGTVLALDKNSGSTIWKNERLVRRDTSAPLLLGSHLVVGDYEGYLHAMNLEDGSIVARFRLDGGNIQSAPEELDDGLLVQTSGGEVYSLAIH